MNEKLFAKLVEIANKSYDGHVTIMKFTNGWKVVFATPALEIGTGDYQEIKAMPAWETVDQAMVAAIAVEVLNETRKKKPRVGNLK